MGVGPQYADSQEPSCTWWKRREQTASDVQVAVGAAASEIGNSFESHGCRVDDLSIVDLFEKYQKA
jgi:hypothetical protein